MAALDEIIRQYFNINGKEIMPMFALTKHVTTTMEECSVVPLPGPAAGWQRRPEPVRPLAGRVR